MCQEKKAEKDLLAFKITIDASIQRHKDYIDKVRGRLITALRNNTDNTNITRIEITKKKKHKWEGKQLSVHFNRQKKNISHEKTWTWLRKGNYKRETESLLIDE